MHELLNFLLPLQSVAIFNILPLSYSSKQRVKDPFYGFSVLRSLHSIYFSEYLLRTRLLLYLSTNLVNVFGAPLTPEHVAVVLLNLLLQLLWSSPAKLTTREWNLFFLKQKQMLHFVRLRSYNYDKKSWNHQSDNSSWHVLFLLLLSLLFLKTQVKDFTYTENVLS